MPDISRRSLLSSSIQLAAGTGLAALPSTVLGANDTVNVGIIGLGQRSGNHITAFGRQANCRILAVCDVNQAAQERAVALVEKVQDAKPQVFSDMRRLLEDKQIDAVSFATPNHWHALGTIWACQAGKDVYVEKPVCHNVWEGQRMIEAARKYGRMVQSGTQGRSSAANIRAMQLLQQGVIGKIYMAKGLCYKWRPSIGHTAEGPTPPGLDWNMFLGPAPLRPYSQNRFLYNWHWFWDTGNGDIGCQGPHQMDLARWGLGEIGLPKSVVSTGGKYVFEDDQETPNTQLATFDYGDREIVFEVRGLLTGSDSEAGLIGDVFFGSDGFMDVDATGFRVFKGASPRTAGRAPGPGAPPKSEKVMEEKHSGPSDDIAHFGNFLEAVRSRNPKDLAADIETGVKSAALVHLANISYRLGRKLAVDPDRWMVPGDAEANRMLTREYRAPYVVPAKV